MGLRWQEKLFAALAWLPKATVQATLGPIALAEATTPKEKAMGKTVLTIAVLAILATAPFGSILIKCTGPCLLLKEGDEDVTAAEHDEAGDDEDDAKEGEEDLEATED